MEFSARITHVQACELVVLHSRVIPLYLADTPHRELLFEYLIHTYYHLVALVKKNKKSYRLKFTNPEALSFLQVWETIDTSGQDVANANLVILQLYRYLDQAAAHQRRIINPGVNVGLLSAT